ncbi:MAG: hypothetical protein ACREOD_08095 [Candidatus Dormibacteria bacterium]
MTSSPAHVREGAGSGVAERFIRTLKAQLLWVEGFEALHAFKERYNRTWLVEKHRRLMPAAARTALLNDKAASPADVLWTSVQVSMDRVCPPRRHMRRSI